MSRTKKDRPSELKYSDKIAHYGEPYDDIPKKPKRKDTTWHWLQGTPSWWVRMFMTKPQRRENKLWEREAVKTPIEELEDLDKPNVSRKPHEYYW